MKKKEKFQLVKCEDVFFDSRLNTFGFLTVDWKTASDLNVSTCIHDIYQQLIKQIITD